VAKRSGIAIDELERKFKKGDFDPVYLVYGEEDYLIDRAVESLLTHAVDDATRSFNTDVVYGSAVSGRDLVSLATAFPMMAERRVVVVREFEKTSEKEKLEPYLQDPLPSTLLLLVCAKPDFRQKIYKLLEQKGVCVESRRLSEDEIASWISKRASKAGKSISADAAGLLQSYIGSSLREASNELEKLFLFSEGRDAVSVEDVKSVVALSKEYSIFDLQRAIGSGDASLAQTVLTSMLSSGESVVGIIAMLTKYFQKVMLVQELSARGTSEFQLTSRLRLSPARVREYVGAARRFPARHLQRCFRALLEADEQIKTSTGGTQYTVMDAMLYRCMEKVPQKTASPYAFSA
jgi:DNA polymerase-3 subunit delta